MNGESWIRGGRPKRRLGGGVGGQGAKLSQALPMEGRTSRRKQTCLVLILSREESSQGKIEDWV